MIDYIFIGFAVIVVLAVFCASTIRKCAYRKRARRINDRVEQILARNRVL
jgi:septation ring formation regulator EzrA